MNHLPPDINHIETEPWDFARFYIAGKLQDIPAIMGGKANTNFKRFANVAILSTDYDPERVFNCVAYDEYADKVSRLRPHWPTRVSGKIRKYG